MNTTQQLKNEIMKFSSKWITLENIMLSKAKDPEIQIWHEFIYMWITSVKSLIMKLQFLEPQRLSIRA